MTVIKIQESVKREVEVDVAFPIYARHDIDGDGWVSTYFMRRNIDGTTCSICHNDRGGFEVEVRKTDFRCTADYLLGTGCYKSSEAEFVKALARAREILSKCDVPET